MIIEVEVDGTRESRALPSSHEGSVFCSCRRLSIATIAARDPTRVRLTDLSVGNPTRPVGWKVARDDLRAETHEPRLLLALDLLEQPHVAVIPLGADSPLPQPGLNGALGLSDVPAVREATPVAER